MLVERVDLENYLFKELMKISSNTKKKKAICVELEDEFNIPVAISSDILSLRKELNYYSDFLLFTVLLKIQENKLEAFYTDKEIKRYTKEKYESEKVKFPLTFKVIQVDKDQWIGTTGFNDLMLLRNSGLINYNENTQRTLTRKIKNGEERFFISINKIAVEQIRESFLSNTYIPDTITLNMQEDDENLDFSYNPKTNELRINSITALDIIDGYHRYLAFCQIYDIDKSADYPIEIRITNYSESKANQFIYQADQKTQMKKSDSNSFNQYDAGNQIAERLNLDSRFDLNGEILKNGGKIDLGVLAAAINGFYFKRTTPTKKDVINISKELKIKINEFVEEYEEYLDKRWDTKEIITIIYCIKNNYTPEDIVEKTEAVKNISIKKLLGNGKVKANADKILKEV